MLERVKGLLPPHTPVMVVEDREFGVVSLMSLAEALEWDDWLRVKATNHIGLSDTGQWIELRCLTPERGQS